MFWGCFLATVLLLGGPALCDESTTALLPATSSGGATVVPPGTTPPVSTTNAPSPGASTGSPSHASSPGASTGSPSHASSPGTSPNAGSPSVATTAGSPTANPSGSPSGWTASGHPHHDAHNVSAPVERVNHTLYCDYQSDCLLPLYYPANATNFLIVWSFKNGGVLHYISNNTRVIVIPEGYSYSTQPGNGSLIINEPVRDADQVYFMGDVKWTTDPGAGNATEVTWTGRAAVGFFLKVYGIPCPECEDVTCDYDEVMDNVEAHHVKYVRESGYTAIYENTVTQRRVRKGDMWKKYTIHNYMRSTLQQIGGNTTQRIIRTSHRTPAKSYTTLGPICPPPPQCTMSHFFEHFWWMCLVLTAPPMVLLVLTQLHYRRVIRRLRGQLADGHEMTLLM